MPEPRQPSRSLKTIFRGIVLIVTLGAIGWMIRNSWGQLAEKAFRFDQIEWLPWLMAVLVYVATMLLSNLFWYRVLIAMDQKPRLTDCLVAFFASQLGKYVPGKAMVVIIRTDLIRSDQVNTRVAAASVFVETLTWIFVGSAIASVLLIVRFEQQTTLQVTAGLLTLIAGVLTWPAVFRNIAIRLSGLGRSAQADVFKGIRFPTMAFGWVLLTAGWCLNGFSLWLVLQGLPGVTLTFDDWILTLACVSLATVAGFVSLLPGGMGVRELVMIPLLSPAIGSANAIIAAIVIRLVWLSAELLSAGIIYGCRFVIQPRESSI